MQSGSFSPQASRRAETGVHMTQQRDTPASSWVRCPAFNLVSAGEVSAARRPGKSVVSEDYSSQTLLRGQC